MSRGSLAASFDHYSPPKTEQLLGITTFLGPQVTQAPPAWSRRSTSADALYPDDPFFSAATSVMYTSTSFWMSSSTRPAKAG